MTAKPCVYCGFVGDRFSDEDCPANPKKMPPIESQLAEAIETLEAIAGLSYAYMDDAKELAQETLKKL